MSKISLLLMLELILENLTFLKADKCPNVRHRNYIYLPIQSQHTSEAAFLITADP